MTAPIAVAFKIEVVGNGYFVPILIDATGYEFFRSCASVCADQAASCATRGGTRPLRYDGMFRIRAGERELTDDRHCNLTPRDWTWPHHGWTHGTLKRMERIAS